MHNRKEIKKDLENASKEELLAMAKDLMEQNQQLQR